MGLLDAHSLDGWMDSDDEDADDVGLLVKTSFETISTDDDEKPRSYRGLMLKKRLSQLVGGKVDNKRELEQQEHHNSNSNSKNNGDATTQLPEKPKKEKKLKKKKKKKTEKSSSVDETKEKKKKVKKDKKKKEGKRPKPVFSD
jgi:hypothetical protein